MIGFLAFILQDLSLKRAAQFISGFYHNPITAMPAGTRHNPTPPRNFHVDNLSRALSLDVTLYRLDNMVKEMGAKENRGRKPFSGTRREKKDA
jgi:hypothetical protein